MTDGVVFARLRSAARAVKRKLLGGPETRRAAYKAVWNAQSATEDAAKVAVAGYVDEGEFRRTAEGTLALLEQSVGVRPTDVIVEIGCGAVSYTHLTLPTTERV